MAPSIYEDLRGRDGMSDQEDVEERAAMAVDEENLGGHYQDYDLDQADLFDGTDSQITTESTAFLTQQQARRPSNKSTSRGRKTKESPKSKWLSRSPRLLQDDGDDDVPASLLIEEEMEAGPSHPPHEIPSKRSRKQPPTSDHHTRDVQAQWEKTKARQRLHPEENARKPVKTTPRSGIFTGTPQEQAMWFWINVTNLDNFMRDVYHYYTGHGIWCICLDRSLSLLTVIFVGSFSTFLTQCIDYTKIPHSTSMSQILVPQCMKRMSGMPNLIIWLLVLYVIYQFFLIIIDIRRLKRMHDFYLHLLNIPDSDMQTISWQEVVARIMSLRDANPITADIVAPRLRHFMGSQSKQRLDAVDIANRLMRRENYLIAMFNKEILDLTLPIPFFKNRQIFSKTIEWNIHFTIMDFIFSQEGQIQELVLKDAKRRQLSDALKSRFFFAGLMNIICAPGIVIYLLISYFFRYFQEYQKNPSAVNARAYTPLAEWKFREFNELYHLFHRRMDMSYPFAQRYVDQFPRIKSVSVASFIAFVAGGLVSVLALASIIDPELFLGFEITPDRTVLFYLGVLGTIWAACHGAVPPDHVVFDPEYALRNVIDYTHYSPVQWKDRLHSNEVKQEFSELYKMKIVIFIEEILSIIFLPFILWFSLPKCSDRIIDFFREFTVHVDGLGYVCSFAVFDFKKGVGSMAPNGASNAADGLKDEYYSTKHGKMAASYYGFLDNYATNPKTGIPGHIPPGMRHPFYPPPAFPGLMSHSLGGDMQLSRNGRTERPKPRSSAAAAAGIIPTRTPRFPPTAGLTSPMPSMLLDPHHQPSTSGFGGGGGGGGRSVHATGNRSRYQASRHIIEDFPVEDEEEDEVPGRGRIQRQISLPSEESGLSGLDGSRWETSPTRKDQSQAGMEEDEVGGGGVLGLLYQFQKAQTDGRAGVNI